MARRRKTGQTKPAAGNARGSRYVRVTVGILSADHAKLTAMATKKQQDLSDVLRDAVRQYLDGPLFAGQ